MSEEKKKHAGGRPTDYNEDILRKAKEYRDIKRPTDDEVIPTVEGLALHLSISRKTVYAWAKEEGKEEFCNIVEEILIKQSATLQNSGLNNKFNASITKLLLSSNHGKHEKIETEHSGQLNLLNSAIQKSKESD